MEDAICSMERVVDLLIGAGYTPPQARDGVGHPERVKQEQPLSIFRDPSLPAVDGFSWPASQRPILRSRGISILATIA